MRPVLLLPCLLLVACGGGGGSGEAALVQLDGANGVPVAAQVIAAEQLAYGMIDLVDAFGAILDGEPAPSCDAGSVDLVVEDALPSDVLSTSDSLRLAFHGCGIDLDGEFVTLDGSLFLEITEVVETPPSGWHVRFTVTFGNLSFAYGADTVTLKGRMTGDSSTEDGHSYVDVVTGDLSATAHSGGETATIMLDGFRSEETRDDVTGDYARGFSGRVTSSAMGGAVEVDVVTPFTGNGDAAPTAGESVLRGAHGSEVHIVAVGGVGVRIDIDVDGDGTPENVVDTTWTDIS